MNTDAPAAGAAAAAPAAAPAAASAAAPATPTSPGGSRKKAMLISRCLRTSALC